MATQVGVSTRFAGLALAATLAGVACPEVARANVEIAKVQHVVRGFDAPATPAAGIALERKLAQLDDAWTVANDAATLLLDDALLDVDQLTPSERHAVRACVARHIADAEAGLAGAISRHAGSLDSVHAELDKLEIAEYLVTCERLREVHALLA